MIKIYTAIFLLATTSANLFGQSGERIISGQLKSTEDGSPLPGVNINIKGTAKGTVTDGEGRYSISVPVGSILIFSFIGMQTREVRVTETGLQTVKGNFLIKSKSQQPRWNPSILDDTVHNNKGVTALSENLPTYKISSSSWNPEDIVGIHKVRTFNGWRLYQNHQRYIIRINSDYFVPKGFRIQLSSSIGVENVGQLPKLQNEFGQGRSINGVTTWRGADSKETMCWGPPIKTLEYDGSLFSYDPGGLLVVAGTGNGRQAQSFDPLKFFRKGFSQGNEITAFFPGLRGSTGAIDFTHKKHVGIFPNSSSLTDNFSARLIRVKIAPHLNANASIVYSNSEGKLVLRGANLSTLVGSILLTPPTFDNANRHASQAANNHSDVYRIGDGSVRSFAPGKADNPYGLANELPDQEKVSRLVSSVGLHYNSGKQFEINLNSSYDHQINNITHGLFPGHSGYLTGRRTDRNEEAEHFQINFSPNWRIIDQLGHQLEAGVSYQFNQEKRNVIRIDGFGFEGKSFEDIYDADSLNNFTATLNRNIHEIRTKLGYSFSMLDLQVSNRNYFSNTVVAGSYINFFPSIHLKLNVDEGLELWPIYELRPFGSLSRTIRESPLIYSNLSSLSTRLPSSQYNTYFEDMEIILSKTVSPEIENKFEAGLLINALHNFHFNFTYYNNTTFGILLPVWNGKLMELENAATINNVGTNATFSYNSNNYQSTKWGFSFHWTKFNNRVTRLNLPFQFLLLSGFTNVATVAKVNEPFGVIYGTAFLRDEKGRKIIGNDGFPVVDPQLKKIGNPISNFNISFEPYLHIAKKIRLGLVLDYKNGGQVWNGTQAVLNYVGKSAASAQLRNISSYVFDGVNFSGALNTVPVSFDNPQSGTESNRWVRYGFSGVGEEYIEDATWIRLNELSLSYKIIPSTGSKLEMILSFIGKNLLLITPYTGVDPSSTLFGYSAGAGLDLFNMPSVRSYNFQMTIKI